MNNWIRTIFTTIMVLCLPGCWDAVELTNRAIVISSAFDWKDDKYRVSYQIVVPGALSPRQVSNPAEGRTFFVSGGEGESMLDAAQDTQTHMSRQVFLGHRKNIFIGEPLAKHGLADSLDVFSRNPDARLRTDMFVVEGDRAESVMHISAPVELLPGVAALKSRQNVGAKPGTSLMDFLISAADGTSGPTLPAVKVIHPASQQGRPSVEFAGRAVFDPKLKLVGYLDFREAVYRLWMLGKITVHTFKTEVPGYPNRFVSFDSVHMKSQLRPKITHSQLTMNVDLQAYGILRENNTSLDLSKTENIKFLENVISKDYERHLSDFIRKIQQDYRVDCLGYNLATARAYPAEWRKLKVHWSDVFPNIKSNVHVHIVIRRSGNTSTPLQNGTW